MTTPLHAPPDSPTPPVPFRRGTRLRRLAVVALLALAGLVGWWYSTVGASFAPASPGVSEAAVAAITPSHGGAIHSPRVPPLAISGTRASVATSSVAKTSESSLSTLPHPFDGLTLEQVEAALLGEWSSHYHGRMVLEKRPDHTARLKIRFDFVAALLYGPRLTLDLRWDLQGDILTHTIIAGEPKAGYERLVRDYGSTSSYRIVEFSRDRVVMDEVKFPDERHVWERIVPEE